MELHEQERGRHLVLRGRLDGRAAPDLRQALQRAVDAGTGDLLVDVRHLVLADVPAIGLFLEAHRRAQRSGRRVLLVGVQPPLERVLRITRLERVLLRADGAGRPAAATA